MGTDQLFYLCVIIGLLLMGAEIFVPGGVLGVFGGMALLVAVGLGFAAFGPDLGVIAAFAIIIFLGVSIVLWMYLLPKTGLGKRLTLSADSAGFHSHGSTAPPQSMRGKEGVTLTPLGPSGIARIDGQRLDVVAEGTWIKEGARVKVMQIVGNHITVREVPTAPEGDPS